MAIKLGKRLIIGCICSFMVMQSALSEENGEGPWIIAHRGASGYAPENTLAAIEKALEQNAHAIEIDFRQTRDCVLVAMHDSKVNRTTNGKGRIKNLSFAAARKLDAGSWFAPQFSSQIIPTIDEVVKAVGNKSILIAELKRASGNCESPAKQAIEAAREAGLDAHIIIKSFYPELLDDARAMAPEIKQIYVYLYYSPLFNFQIDHRVKFNNPWESEARILQEHRCSLNQDSVAAIQAAGKEVVMWDVQTRDEMIEAIEMGVDAIETDYPDVALSLIKQLEGVRLTGKPHR